MADGGRIATAFVDIRPDAESFQSQADAEIRQKLGDRPFDVATAVKLEGVGEARRELRALSQSVKDAGGQLQIDGLQTASADVNTLRSDIQRVSDVNLEGTFDPLVDSADEALQAARHLSEATNVDFATGFLQGATEATDQAAALSEVSGELNTELTSGESIRQALSIANDRAIATEAQLAASSRVTKQALVEEAGAESLLEKTRIRARRASSIGPLRLAGIGVGAGVAIFTATSAVGELGSALEVTGNEANTTEGKFRNFGSALLGGNIVGAFKALGDQVQSYDLAAVRAIDTSDELIAKLNKAGIELSDIKGLTESRAAALAQLTEVPAFLQTAQARIARDGGGDKEELRNLQAQEDALADQLRIAQTLNATQAQINAVRKALFEKQKDIDDAQAEINQERQSRKVARLQERVVDAQLSGSVTQEIAALQAEGREYQRLIDATNTAADDRQQAKNDLQAVNSRIESLQDQLVAEEARHSQAMFQKRLIPTDVAEQQAILAGDVSAQIAALQAENAVIQGVIDTKKLRGNALANKLAAINSNNATIRGLQAGIVAEEQSNAAKLKQGQDDHHQAILQGITNREAQIQNQVAAAALDASLANDIKFQRQLVAFYRKQIENEELTKQEVAAFISKRISAQTQLAELIRQDREAGQQRVLDAITAREDKLNDYLLIAQADDRSTDDDAKQLRRKIAFYDKQSKNMELSVEARRDFLVKEAQARRQLRDLDDQEKTEETGASFAQQAFKFLQETKGFSSNLASNVLPRDGGGVGAFLGGSSSTAPKPPVTPGGSGKSNITSPFERPFGESGRDDAAAGALAFRGAGGTTPTGGQMDALIHINRQMLRALTDIRTGLGHPEAAQTRKSTTHRVEVGVE